MRCECGCHDMNVNTINGVCILLCCDCRREYTMPEEALYAYEENPITKRIHRLRYLVLFHSYAYYHLGENFVSDHTWSEWALELKALQTNNEELAKTVRWASIFEEFDPSTGFDLEIPEKIKQKVMRFNHAQKTIEKLYYDPDKNIFLDRNGDIVYDLYKFVTVNNLLLFKKNKQNITITNLPMRRVDLIYGPYSHNKHTL